MPSERSASDGEWRCPFMARLGPPGTSAFPPLVGGEADINRRMRAVAIDEYAPAEAKLALADDSTSHD